MFDALSTLGVEADPVVYSDNRVDAVRTQLLDLEGVLVWVNPIEQGLDRSRLDLLLHEVADEGVWVSAHPDVIRRMATKQVLVDTAAMSWSGPTHLYHTADQLRSELSQRLRTGPIVLKQQRGMGGDGVWKVEPADEGRLLIHHAASGSVPEVVSPDEFGHRCEPYFAKGAVMVEQPFLERLAEGMIRVYLSHDVVVGFAHQYPRGLLDPKVASSLPTDKVFHPPSAERYQRLRQLMESRWVGELQEIVGVDRSSLPAIWDADFLLGDTLRDGQESYVLCEINASSTFAFPEFAMAGVAQAALRGISGR